jgi:hypothetical protein
MRQSMVCLCAPRPKCLERAEASNLRIYTPTNTCRVVCCTGCSGMIYVVHYLMLLKTEKNAPLYNIVHLHLRFSNSSVSVGDPVGAADTTDDEGVSPKA